jgi:hypothetical protein
MSGMPSYLLIPFAIFFVCCALQFWFVKRVRDQLIDRHPDIFLKQERASFFPHNHVWRYAFDSRYRELGDPELDRRVRNLRLLLLVAFGSWLAIAICMVTMPKG